MILRYLGNKDSIVETIKEAIRNKVKISSSCIFFDAFCGTGAVSNAFKNECNIVLNDNLHCSSTFAHGRISAANCSFTKLGFDPIDYFNSNNNTIEGYFFKTYSLGGSSRMYFSEFNASRIDYFRNEIEEWHKDNRINDDEYSYLLACLIDSVSSVSNTAGVYGAFLKKWDARALKNIEFLDISDKIKLNGSCTVYSEKIEEIIEDVECDILYLDPPYTQNQYGTQYHLLETLILNDEPEKVSTVTGSRSTKEMRSDWSKIYKVHILLDKIISKTKASHIFLSYNNHGDMSKEYIESTLKRYGYDDSYDCIRIPYKKYENWKSQNEEKNYEYLFYIHKKPNDEVVYESPLNYIGSKAKIVPQIKEKLVNCDTFVDLFGGGFNVGINVSAERIIYNDINHLVKELIESFKMIDTYDYICYVKKFIDKFNLEKGNKDTYIAARDYYNSLPFEKRDPRMLFALILYSFQQQIRFNSKLEFNNTVGVRWFNDAILSKLVSFSRVVKEKNIEFLSNDYVELTDKILGSENIFVYMDPPYKLTTGSYNDGKRGFKGWNNELECELFSFIDKLSENHIPCMLSYVIEHKGEINEELINWIENNNYNCIQFGEVIGISGQPRKEVVILNYD